MFEGEATRVNQGKMTQSSINLATKSQMQVIALDSEYPRIKKKFAPSLSMKKTKCREATSEAQICKARATTSVSNSPMIVSLPPSSRKARSSLEKTRKHRSPGSLPTPHPIRLQLLESMMHQ